MFPLYHQKFCILNFPAIWQLKLFAWENQQFYKTVNNGKSSMRHGFHSKLLVYWRVSGSSHIRLVKVG
jgi:hypothetical protein